MKPTAQALRQDTRGATVCTLKGERVDVRLNEGHTLAEASAGSARDAIEVQLCDIWSRQLGVAAVGRDDDFFALGGDSLAAMRVVTETERLFGVELSVADFVVAATVTKVAEMIRADGKARARGVLVRCQAGDGSAPIYLVHSLAGTILEYGALIRTLGSEQAVWGLQAVGLDMGRATPWTIEAMADTYLTEMRRVHGGGPWHLAGYSMGGVIAFELAKRLSAAGERVALVALLDTYGPVREKDPAEHVVWYFGVRSMVDLLQLDIDLEAMCQLPRPEQVATLAEFAARTAALPADYGAAEVERLLRIRMVNRLAEARYQPTPYGGPVVLVRVAGDGNDPDSAEYLDGCLGWAGLAESVTQHAVPGTHQSLLRPPHVAAVARTLRAYVIRDVSPT